MGELLSEILTRSDDGTEYVILEYAPDVIAAGNLGNPGATIRKDLKTFVTRDGDTVNVIDGNTFEVHAVSGVVRVRRVE